MGNFHSSSSSRSSSSSSSDEEEGGYPNVQNEYKSNGDSSEASLKPLLAPPPLICSSRTSDDPSSHSSFSTTHGSLTDEEADDQFANAPDNEIVEESVGIIKSREEEREGEVVKRSIVVVEKQNPLIPIQDPLVEPLLTPPPPICSPSSHSSFSITHGSLPDEQADDQIRWLNEIVEKALGIIKSRVEERVVKRIIKSREEEREGEVVKRRRRRSGEEKKREKEKENIIKHYSSHEILLVGEGDFSFSACLAVAFGSAANITATSLDSKEFLKKNYGNAMSNIAELRRRGSKVMHGIDATQIANHQVLGQLNFDRIIFNFPYAGFFRNMPTDSLLRLHRKLVSRFLMNAKKMISENGEIHITHKTNGFHAEFMVESIASSHGLRLIEAVKFKCSDYPGYNTKYGFGGDNNFDWKPSKTYKFGLKTTSL